MSKRKFFVLPKFKLRKASHKLIQPHLAHGASSPQRIRDQTPSLKALYEFLARPLP